MAEVASAFVSLMPSAKGFGSSMNRQIGPQINSSAKTAGSRFGKVFAYSSMSPLKAIGAAAVGLFAVQKVKDFFGSAISEARESQKVSAITAQVIKSTGGAANISANQVGNLATQISNMTGIDDEAIQSGANLLLTFKNIRNEAGAGNDIFDQTTKIMTDMATAMGNEPKAAAIQLGKALNDPIKGISALSRVGVTFSDDQKKVIESLVASGDVAGAQKVILKELKSEFGGTAEAAATAGDKFRTTFANFQEAVGTALLPYLDMALTKGTEFISFLMNRVPPAFAAFKDAIEPVTSAISDLIGNHLEAFHTALAALGGAGIASVVSLIGGGLVAAIVALVGVLASPVVLIGALAGALIYAYTKSETFRQVVGQVIAWIKSDFIPGFLAVVSAVRGFAEQVIPIIQEAVAGLIARLAPLVPRVVAVFQQIWSTIKDVMTLIGAVIKVALAVLIWEWQHFGQNVLDFVSRTFSNIVTVVSGVLNVLQGVIRLVLSLIKGDWSGAWDALKQIVQGVWQIINGLVSQAVAQLQLILAGAWAVIKAGASAAWDQIKKIPGLALAAAKAIIGAELGAIKAVALAAWNAIKSAASATWNAIKAVIQGQINAAKGAVSAAVGGIKSAMSGLADLVGRVRGWFAAMLSAIKDKLGEAVQFVGSIPGKIRAALGDLSNMLYAAGRQVIEGLVNGIVDKARDAAAAAANAARSVANAAKGALGIHSPSKVFHEIGGFTIQGLADGIIERTPAAVNAALGAATKVQGAVLDKLTSMRDGVKSVLDGLRSDFDSLKSSVASAFTGDLFSATNASDFLTNLTSTRFNVAAISRAFHKLEKWGLRPDFLAQLFQSGNGALILDLASGSRRDALNAGVEFGAIQSLSNQLGGAVARDSVGPKIDRTNARLERIEKAIDRLPKNFGQEINKAVSHGQKKAS